MSGAAGIDCNILVFFVQEFEISAKYLQDLEMGTVSFLILLRWILGSNSLGNFVASALFSKEKLYLEYHTHIRTPPRPIIGVGLISKTSFFGGHPVVGGYL